MPDPLKLQPPDEYPEEIMDAHDRGWRKYFLVILAMFLATLGFLGVHFWPDWHEPYKTYGGLLIEILAIYVVGNVGYKGIAGYMNGKFSSSTQVTIEKKPPEGNG